MQLINYSLCNHEHYGLAINVSLAYNYRMAKTAKRLNAILDYMRKVKSSISMVFGLVF